jgi:hypothetical protein
MCVGRCLQLLLELVAVTATKTTRKIAMAAAEDAINEGHQCRVNRGNK